MVKTDVNCFLGNWPFRRLRHNTLHDLQAVHAKNGFSLGYVASLSSIFNNDPIESEEELYDILKGSSYRQIYTVNPTLPALSRNIAEGVERFNIAGVRIYPGYHQFKLDDPCMRELRAVLKKYNLPLYVTAKIEDERLNYMITPRTVSCEEMMALTELMQDVKILFTGVMTYEAVQMKEVINSSPNVFVETSYFKGPTGCMEYALSELSADKLLFGSAYAYLCFKSALLQIETASIQEEQKRKVLAENAARFFVK